MKEKKQNLKAALVKLQASLAVFERTSIQELKDMQDAKNEVLAHYQYVFHPDNIQSLTEEEFRDFLLFKNNRHWNGLHRQGNKICTDMKVLRKALTILVDENMPISKRLDILRPKQKAPMVPHCGRAIITAILLMVYPEKYGVWNSTSVAGMKALNIYPSFDRGATFGKKYDAINNLLKTLKKELHTDLWTLDALWWQIINEPPPKVDGEDDEQRFYLEKYLHEFMVDNWDMIELSKSWNLYTEDDELVGYKYNTGEVGEIDLLAKHKRASKWLVIELKKGQTSDQTVGQVLRYMGWVKKNLALKKDEVHGLIIGHETDEKLRCALEFTNNVDLQLYSVEFKLQKK